MDPIVSFLKDDTLPEEKSEAEKIRRKSLGSSCPRITSCTNVPILGRICYVYILKHQSYYSRSCMTEFVGVTQEKYLCPTEPSLKDISGRVCRSKPKNTSRSVINARGLLQTSTNQKGSSILSLVLGRLLSGA